ncbi:MAG: aryl-sulfate sulfotransferase [Chitinophagaceae bacterium]
MLRYWSIGLAFGFMIFFAGCAGNSENIVKEIKVGLHHNNELKIQIDVETNSEAEVFAEYWPDSSGTGGKMSSPVSKKGLSHSLVLGNIIPKTNYTYHIVTIQNGKENPGKTYTFQSRGLPPWLQEQFKYNCTRPELLPQEFKKGLMLMNKRETPGVLYMVDYKGQLKWYHMIDGTGFKVTHFTKDTSIISILGKNDEPTSYGSEILEINLLGDTLFHLKKGQGDFTHVIHHEILKKSENEIVTLFVDERIMDLSSIGGGKKDTINGDGILIMDRNGKKVWQWSVFDVMNPFDDPRLLIDKKDWMHANSLNYDKDSNFIISFYNNGQVWKLDVHTGKVIWKLGKGGNIVMPAECNFNQAHAVHINPSGSLMFFDNGVEKHQSSVFAMKMQDEEKKAQLSFHIKLPPEVYNDRMGSAYMIGDSLVLCCCSKRHITVLTDLKGVLLWTLDTAIPPYRVEFIAADKVKPYIMN